MNRKSSFINKTKFIHAYIAIFFVAILLIYGCGEKTTEVPPAAAPHCIEAALLWPVPDDCTLEVAECCGTEIAGNLISFTFTRTDVPNPEPILKNPNNYGFSIQDGMCRTTAILLTEELMEKGYGRWQVTNSVETFWEFACDEITITEQTGCMNYPPFPGNPGSNVVETTAVSGVDGCEVDITTYE